jgi:hypothetical protein
MSIHQKAPHGAVCPDFVPLPVWEHADEMLRLKLCSDDARRVRALVFDERMRECYELLQSEFDEPMQWRGFVYAAWSTWMDFGRHRDRVRLAAELAAQIAETAAHLSRLLRQFEVNGVPGPWEFYSTAELLCEAESVGCDGWEWEQWVEAARNSEDSGSQIALSRIFDAMPPPHEIMNSLARAARLYTPSAHCSLVRAAIETRQRSPKTEYLRAFCQCLREVHGIRLTRGVLRAVAAASTVVGSVDDPEFSVTYDDVRKAVARLSKSA